MIKVFSKNILVKTKISYSTIINIKVNIKYYKKLETKSRYL